MDRPEESGSGFKGRPANGGGVVANRRCTKGASILVRVQRGGGDGEGDTEELDEHSDSRNQCIGLWALNANRFDDAQCPRAPVLANGALRPGVHLRGGGEPITRVGLTAMRLAGAEIARWGQGALEATRDLDELLA